MAFPSRPLAVWLDGGAPGFFLALATLGGLRSLWNSQCNAFVMGLLLLGVAAAARDRWRLAAAWMGASILAKLTPIPVVLLFVAIRPRQLLPRLALVLILGGLLPFATRPAQAVLAQYGGLAEQMHQTATRRWPGFRDAWTVWQVLRQFVAARRESRCPSLRISTPTATGSCNC